MEWKDFALVLFGTGGVILTLIQTWGGMRKTRIEAQIVDQRDERTALRARVSELEARAAQDDAEHLACVAERAELRVRLEVCQRELEQCRGSI